VDPQNSALFNIYDMMGLRDVQSVLLSNCLIHADTSPSEAGSGSAGQVIPHLLRNPDTHCIRKRLPFYLALN
jgi:hypothetical protein